MNHCHTDSTSRRGMTLIEVLMALMIMSIGVSAVAVLFPISTLRSVRASQQTNAGIVAYNVRELINVYPELIFDPDFDGNLEEHFRNSSQNNYVVDPVGYYTLAEDAPRILPATAPQFYQRYGNTEKAPSSIRRFGGPHKLISRPTSDGAAFQMGAQRLGSQGDGWETIVEAQPERDADGNVVDVANFGGVNLVEVDLSDVPRPQMYTNLITGSEYDTAVDMIRVVLFSDTGRFSQAFPVTSISGNTVYFTEDFVGPNGSLDGLEDVNRNGFLDERQVPRAFLSADGTPGVRVSRVLIQSRKLSDYTWMLNVRRRSDGLARSVDVVVRFGGGVKLSDERGHPGIFVAGTTNAYINNAAGVEAPIRRGGHVFDAVNGIWYRIQQVNQHADFDYHVILQSTINEGAGNYDPTTGVPSPSGPFGAAIVPTGVVDVYPLGSFPIPDSLRKTTF